jgi:hypothetical protein
VISAKDGGPARRARARVSWQEIEAPRPRVGFDVERLAPTVKLNAVRVEEIDPPAGVKPIVWLLLTTHPVENLEDSPIETPEAMAKLALVVLIAALRACSWSTRGRERPAKSSPTPWTRPLSRWSKSSPGSSKARPSSSRTRTPKGALARLSWVVGRLGGWDGYIGRGYKPPGPITVTRGLARFDAIREGWEIRQNV